MKPELIGEVGINFNGDINIAKQLIDNLVKYGWDAVKFQIRDVETVIPKSMWDKPKDTPWGEMKYIDYKKHLELSEDDFDIIDNYCKEKKIDWFASCWDMKSQNFFEEYNCKYNKIASAMATYKPLVEHIAKQGKLTFISTAVVTNQQIQKIVDLFVDNDTPFVLMHATGLYPCPLDQLNLHRIKTLRKEFECPVGYSGHSEGSMDAIVAKIFGAECIEKHVTLNRSMWGSDQSASIEPSGMEFISKHCRHIPMMLGDSKNKIEKNEKKNIDRMRWWKDEDNI